MLGAVVGVVCRPEVGNPRLGADSDMLIDSLGRVALLRASEAQSHDADQIPAHRQGVLR